MSRFDIEKCTCFYLYPWKRKFLYIFFSKLFLCFLKRLKDHLGEFLTLKQHPFLTSRILIKVVNELHFLNEIKCIKLLRCASFFVHQVIGRVGEKVSSTHALEVSWVEDKSSSSPWTKKWIQSKRIFSSGIAWMIKKLIQKGKKK